MNVFCVRVCVYVSVFVLVCVVRGCKVVQLRTRVNVCVCLYMYGHLCVYEKRCLLLHE